VRYLLIVIMISVVALLGCTQQEIEVTDEQQEVTEQAAETTEQAGEASSYQPGTWITDYNQALQHARKLERPVLVNFTGSDWCIWCKRLSGEVFEKEAFLKFAGDNFVLLKVDFPQKTKLPQEVQKANQALAEKYGIQGFPTIVLIDDKGEEITRTGYQEGGAEGYVKHLKELLGMK